MRAYAITKLILVLSCLALSLPAHTAATKYDVEIIIFEDINNRYINSENWPRLEIDLLPDELPAELRAALMSETDSSKPVRGIRNITPRLLTKQAKKISKSKNYRILTHKAWRQAGLSAKKAINVPINSNATQNANSASSITGYVKLTLARYLHIYTDLVYHKPRHSIKQSAMNASIDNSRYKDFAIKSHRRMRSKEVHYLDHPLVGILVMAVPVPKK